MSEEGNSGRWTAEERKKFIEPVRVETQSHGVLLLAKYGSDGQLEAIASAADQGLDNFAFSVSVLESLVVRHGHEDSSEVALHMWDRNEIAAVLVAYMSDRRSNLIALDESEDIFEAFATQCKSKLNDRLQLMSETEQSLRKTVAPFNAITGYFQKSVTSFLDTVRAPTLKSMNDLNRDPSRQLAESITSMADLHSQQFFNASGFGLRLYSVAGQRLLPSQKLAESIRSFAGIQSQSLFNVSNTLETMAASFSRAIQPDLKDFAPFLGATDKLWEQTRDFLRQLEEQLKRDEQLRAQGIDIERLRLSGRATWLPHVYAVLDASGDDAATSTAIVELASSEVLQNEIFLHLEGLPTHVRETRVDAIGQGLRAHNAGNFIVSCTMLASQLDGLLGDILIELEQLDGGAGDRRKGTRQRITALQSLTDPENDLPKLITQHYMDAGTEVGIESEQPKSFYDVRNNIMHGDPNAEYSREESAKFIFLILSLLSVHVSLDEEG